MNAEPGSTSRGDRPDAVDRNLATGPDHAPGGHIHATDPFATPAADRSPTRRLRGRLAAPVALWTAVDAEGAPAGLTVSSTVVADGDPARVLGLLDAESDLWEAVEATGAFTVAPLRGAHRQLADRFAGLLPAPGGPFRVEPWATTAYGPVLAGLDTWAGCRLVSARPCGWNLLVEATVETVRLGEDTDVLVHFRGRYRTLAPGR